MKPTAIASSLVLLTSAMLPLAAQPDDTAQTAATKVFADRKDSSVQLTVTRKSNGNDRTFEVGAVSFDGKDLLVTSLSAIETGSKGPLHTMSIGGPEEGEEGAAGARDKGELTRVALLRADATEAEADLVLTDAALDLAFIRVRKEEVNKTRLPAAPPLAKDSPALLDQVLATSRKAPEFQRISGAALTQIAALIPTPRPCYLLSKSQDNGSAVFNLRGELLGITTTLHDQSVVIPTTAIAKLAATLPNK